MTKQNTIYLKGWAVLFMLFLHFGNLSVLPEYQYSWSGNEWEGAFQICVPIFLFLSGYGLMSGSMIKKIVGHSGAMTLTERVYTHLDVETLVEAINKI